MLLTGFDAPVEQVMYLDKVIVAHNLLQAIARVNRIGDAAKEKGFVVDYVGIGHHLKKAIDNYDQREQKEVLSILSSPEDELRELYAQQREIQTFLEKQGLSDLSDHDAFFDLFYDEDVRFKFMSLFKGYTRSMNLVLPAKEALEFLPEYNALLEINILAAKHFRDERLSMKGIPPKLRALTDKYLKSKGIDVKIKPISILDEDFEKQVGKRKRNKTKAAEIEHAIRHHLDIDLDDDPELQASFAKALDKIFKDFANNWNKIYKELEKLRERIYRANQEPTYGLHRKKQMPFFRMFYHELENVWDASPNYNNKKDERISLLVNLTQQVFNLVQRELQLTGFWQSISARNRLKADLQQLLLKADFKNVIDLIRRREHYISRIMEIAQKNHDIIIRSDN